MYTTAGSVQTTAGGPYTTGVEWPHITLHIIHYLAAKHCRDDITTDAVYGQCGAFAYRPRTRYNLGADFPWGLCKKASGGIVWEASK